MSTYELLTTGLSIGNRIDVQWGMFITVHLAIFGGIIYVDRPLRRLEKIGAVGLYVPFAMLHFRGMRQQLNLMSNAFNEVSDRVTAGCCPDNDLLGYVQQDVASGRFETAFWVLVGAHLLMGALVLLAIGFDANRKRRSS